MAHRVTKKVPNDYGIGWFSQHLTTVYPDEIAHLAAQNLAEGLAAISLMVYGWEAFNIAHCDDNFFALPLLELLAKGDLGSALLLHNYPFEKCMPDFFVIDKDDLSPVVRYDLNGKLPEHLLPNVHKGVILEVTISYRHKILHEAMQNGHPVPKKKDPRKHQQIIDMRSSGRPYDVWCKENLILLAEKLLDHPQDMRGIIDAEGIVTQALLGLRRANGRVSKE